MKPTKISRTHSRYHKFEQHDGNGFAIIEIDEGDVTKATVLDANMTREAADARIDSLRADERIAIGGAS